MAVVTEDQVNVCTASTRRISSLDGMRAFSIALVLADHSFMSMPHNVPSSFFGKFGIALLGNGEFGVQVFFVISGFLITHLLRRELSSRGSISLRRFYV